MPQRFQKLVQEDLNTGTELVWITAPGGGELLATQVGLHTFARGQRAYEVAWTPGAIQTTGKASTTVSVPDAATGDYVLASHNQILTSDLRITGHVSASGTVTVVIHNPTAAAVTVGAGTLRVVVFPVVTASASTSKVYGYVYDNNEDPLYLISGADVQIVALSLSTTTDANGYYEFLDVPEGSVEVYAEAYSGSSSGSNTGTVVAGADTQINVVVTGV
jgi:hypothetical protein